MAIGTSLLFLEVCVCFLQNNFEPILINMIIAMKACNSLFTKGLHFDLNPYFMAIAFYLLLHKHICHSIVSLFAPKAKLLFLTQLQLGKHCIRKPLYMCLLAYKQMRLYYLPQYSLLKPKSLSKFSKKYLIFSFVLIWNIMTPKSFLLGLHGNRSCVNLKATSFRD